MLVVIQTPCYFDPSSLQIYCVVSSPAVTVPPRTEDFLKLLVP